VSAATQFQSILDDYLNLNVKKLMDSGTMVALPSANNKEEDTVIKGKLNYIQPSLHQFIVNNNNVTLVLHTTANMLGNKIADMLTVVIKEKKFMKRVHMPELSLCCEMVRIFECLLEKLNQIQKRNEVNELDSVSDADTLLYASKLESSESLGGRGEQVDIAPQEQQQEQQQERDNTTKADSSFKSFVDCDSLLDLEEKVSVFKRKFTLLLKKNLTTLEKTLPLIKALRELESPTSMSTVPSASSPVASRYSDVYGKQLAREVMKMIEFDPLTVFPMQLKAELFGRDIVF
jgi:hypothetical protein